MSAIMKRLTFLLLALLSSQAAEAKGWRGITPLQSSRVEVESLLGRSSDACRCVYETQGATVFIMYSGNPCAPHGPYRYKVPPDTVLEIHVLPKTVLKLNNLNLEAKGYRRVNSSQYDFLAYYISGEKDTLIEFGAYDNHIIRTMYLPTSTNNVPLCLSDWNYDPPSPIKVGEYYGNNIREERQQLDELAKELKEASLFRGYIVIHRGPRSTSRGVQERLEQARRYLSKYKLGATRLVTIWGGVDDKPSVELFLWPRQWREVY